MKSWIYTILTMVLLVFTQCSPNRKEESKTIRVAFGSCGNQDIPQPVLSLAADMMPDVFIFLGDNIYGDSDNMDTLRNKYHRWASQENYAKLIASTPIFATWDDHDFGRNDSGKEYPYKEDSKAIFMDHFQIAKNHEMRSHKGVYHTNYIEKAGLRVQIVMLDVRTFRDKVLTYDGKTKLPRDTYFYKPDYMPHVTGDSTMLGVDQWSWLEKELKKPADFRLICSGSQFGIEFNGYESWANFPSEQKKMLDLIKSTKADGVIFLTGDVHYAEISKMSFPGQYTIYDVTSSGITSTWDFATPNKHRIEGPIMENHFGMITIKSEENPTITFEIIDKTGNQRIEYTIKRSEIKF